MSPLYVSTPLAIALCMMKADDENIQVNEKHADMIAVKRHGPPS